MTAVLPLPFAALAMIAQRKPNLDKGFRRFTRLQTSPSQEITIFVISEIKTAV
ncbi:hypothetical protein [Paraburkholderia sp. BCC1885]|uniref:hypothetical protein n=1 Tax=Paraburkholderia sp. BCC1885 TaxID=2562669 RepID=UPI001643639A|nr:hypothetical protein [Paraburkholderia sp. BCC1885]